MVNREKGIKVLSVTKGPLKDARLKAGDRVLFVNGQTVVDEYDFRFHAASDVATLLILRNGEQKELTMHRLPNTMLGVEFAQNTVMRCANKCIFCFIDQMPKGLRKSLYIKDEDLGHSFTNGNYVTLSAIPFAELERIATLGLSPLFVSVHATDKEVRLHMLGIKKGFDVLDQLRFLAKNYVSFHTQIVVCPGFNDGKILVKTVKDLLSLQNGLLSVAIVPVGLTKHRRFPLTPVDTEKAREICATIQLLSDNDAKKNGRRRVFCADELFIKAGLKIPVRHYYEEYPQIENGVGLIRQLLDEWKTEKKKLVVKKSIATKRPRVTTKKVLIITSISAFTFLKDIANDIEKIIPNIKVCVLAIKNDFFGELVTVAGLLTGGDIIKQVKATRETYHKIIVPRVMFNYQGSTLDGFSEKRLEKELAISLLVVESLSTMVSKL